MPGFFWDEGRRPASYRVMEPQLLGRLVEEHAGPLVLYARQWCLAPEDVVQEAFVKLAAQKETPGNVVAWLYRVVRNGALSAARAERRRQRHESTAAARHSWWLPPAEVELDGAAVTAALEALPREEREVLIAHLWGELTFEQIGELTGTSSSTAHRRYLAGLASLRERLKVPCPPTT